MHSFKSQKAAISSKQLLSFNQRPRSDRYATTTDQETAGKRKDPPNSTRSCAGTTNGHQQGAAKQTENTCLSLQ
jgi:hypothetical protein